MTIEASRTALRARIWASPKVEGHRKLALLFLAERLDGEGHAAATREEIAEAVRMSPYAAGRMLRRMVIHRLLNHVNQVDELRIFEVLPPHFQGPRRDPPAGN